ncbi:MAG: DUF1579 family protein [Phycisphaerales bacterium]
MNTRTNQLLAFTAGSLVTAGAAVLIAAGPDHSNDHNMGTMKEMDSMKQMDPMKEMDPMEHMPEMSAEDMLAGMIKLSTPNEHHAELMETVGNWTAKTSFVMDPTQPPMESDATMTVKSLLDGRHVMSHFKMELNGEPFEGYSIMGYDNAHDEYNSMWIDSMSTKITYMTGNKDEHGNIVMLGTASTPMGDNPMKIVTSKADDGTWTDQFYDMMPDGSWYNSGSIAYTRD